MDIRDLQGYASFFMTIFLVVMLYGYIVHLYRSEKKKVSVIMKNTGILH